MPSHQQSRGYEGRRRKKPVGGGGLRTIISINSVSTCCSWKVVGGSKNTECRLGFARASEKRPGVNEGERGGVLARRKTANYKPRKNAFAIIGRGFVE